MCPWNACRYPSRMIGGASGRFLPADGAAEKVGNRGKESSHPMAEEQEAGGGGVV